MNRPVLRALGLAALVAGLAACSAKLERDGAPRGGPDVSAIADAVPRPEPPSPYGNPASYEVNGKRYYTLKSSKGFVQRGIASWYGTKFHGRRTSSGEVYDMYGMTAAHKTLPLPTYARVTNLRSGRRVVVRINDRGPFHANRVIDLSYAAAKKLGIAREGTGLVEVRAIDPRAPELPPARVIEASGGNGAQGLFIQVGAYTRRENAERMRGRLAGVLGNVAIHRGAHGTGTLYRVRVGPLLDAAAADGVVRTLARLGIGEHIFVFD